jgi:hypothetical protein
MRTTRSTHLILLDLIVLIYLVKSTDYEAPHYAVIFIPCYFLSLRSKYSH